MNCPKCGSSNVNAQVIQETRIENHHHSILWWIFIGWWWLFFKWLFLTVPALIAKVFFRRKVVKQKTVTKWVCQDCGHNWTA